MYKIAINAVKFKVYLLRDIIDPPRTVIIASINPAMGNPVCCIGMVVVSVFNVVVVFGVIGLIGFIGFVGSC